MLKWLLANALLRPSQVPISCAKEEVLVQGRHGRIQLWKEYSGEPGKRIDAGLYILRFLGSRGRAELATLDPADRLLIAGCEVWTVNPQGSAARQAPAASRLTRMSRRVPSSTFARSPRAGPCGSRARASELSPRVGRGAPWCERPCAAKCRAPERALREALRKAYVGHVDHRGRSALPMSSMR